MYRRVAIEEVAKVKVKYDQQEKLLLLVVVKGTGPSLLGRGWLEEIEIMWDEIKTCIH